MEVKDQPAKIETVDQQVLAGDTVQQQGVYCNGLTTYHTNTCVTFLGGWPIIDSAYKKNYTEWVYETILHISETKLQRYMIIIKEM